MVKKYTDDEITHIYNSLYVGEKLSMEKISALTNVSRSTLLKRFKKLGLHSRNNREKSLKYSYNEDYFFSIDSANKAYWLGFMYADGFITSARKNNSKKVGIALAESDIQHLYKFRNCIDGDMPIKIYQQKQGYNAGQNYCRILLSGNKLADDLIRHGVLEHKTNIVQPPQLSDERLLRDFIRGYFDGDGSVWLQKNKQSNNPQYCVEFLGTPDLLEFIQTFLVRNNILDRRYALNTRHNGQTVRNFKFGGNLKSYKFLSFLYDDSNMFLDRKFEKYQELKSMLNSRLYQ